MSETNNTADNWFLQGDEGTIYGPVDTTTLKDWCLEGRIEPDNVLSKDRENWQEAADIPELEMDWLALLDDDSRLGPFNLQLVQGLVENGVIPATAMLENRHTGKQRPAITPDNTDDPQPPPEPTTEDEKDETTDESEGPVETSEPDDPPLKEEDEAPLPEAPEPEKPIDASPLSPKEASSETNEEAHHTELLNKDDLQSDPLPKRLEPLQRSTNEDREQLVESRHTLQSLRAAHTVLQDEMQRLKEELAAAITAQQDGEQQLLEQQDRAAAADTEVENLTAQLEQMKDHYDRLQLENQSQFEKIDDLQATQLHNEQRFKRELTELQDRADAKTELLAGTVKYLMHDEDLAKRLKALSAATAVDSRTEEELTATIKKLEQQLEQQRQQTQLGPHEAANRGGRNLFATLVLFLTGVLLGALLIGQGMNGCKAPIETLAPTQDDAIDNVSVEPPTPEPSDFPLETDDALDLQPEASPQHKPPAATPDETASPSINWPAISLPSVTIALRDDALRIVFNEGLFAVATRLTPEASAALTTLSEQLQGKMGEFQLIIEGHTDATPIAAAGSRYVDNFALGMARAEAVKTFLTQTGKVPANSMRTSSAGESAPPFSNETEADRRRNRTAVLTLVKHDPTS